MTNPTDELRAWAQNFLDLHHEVSNYDNTAAEVATLQAEAADRRGTGQLISFQLAKLLEIVLRSGKPTEGSPVALLISRYSTKLTLMNVEPVPPLDEGRRILGELTLELSKTAQSWAASGVDDAEAERFADEVRADSVVLRAAVKKADQ
ncbi:hypothetical protein CH267_02225 [Rhodococcus sp. 06-621-2]|nr:hypothetical protein [Rhodococcus sp. 06-621-2]OZC62376.1 hypothetical protein CH267_02225 [Rhodococcus sp. 06-621-2]